MWKWKFKGFFFTLPSFPTVTFWYTVSYSTLLTLLCTTSFLCKAVIPKFKDSIRRFYIFLFEEIQVLFCSSYPHFPQLHFDIQFHILHYWHYRVQLHFRAKQWYQNSKTIFGVSTWFFSMIFKPFFVQVTLISHSYILIYSFIFYTIDTIVYNFIFIVHRSWTKMFRILIFYHQRFIVWCFFSYLLPVHILEIKTLKSKHAKSEKKEKFQKKTILEKVAKKKNTPFVYFFS